MKKKLGRRSKLTPELRRRFGSMLGRGHTIRDACGALGIGEKTYFRWCELHPTFLTETQHARARGRIRIVQSILDSRDWRAQAWYLERTDPAEFGRVAERPIPVDPVATPLPELRITIKDVDGTELPLFPTDGAPPKPKPPPTGGNGQTFEFTRS